MLPNDSEAAWRLTESASLFVRVERPEAAGAGLVTVIVERLDDALTELRGRWVEAIKVTAPAAAGRKALLTDPGRNRVEIVELVS